MLKWKPTLLTQIPEQPYLKITPIRKNGKDSFQKLITVSEPQICFASYYLHLSKSMLPVVSWAGKKLRNEVAWMSEIFSGFLFAAREIALSRTSREISFYLFFFSTILKSCGDVFSRNFYETYCQRFEKAYSVCRDCAIGKWDQTRRQCSSWDELHALDTTLWLGQLQAKWVYETPNYKWTY